jgi:prepilin-type N-terminal cleavage/methylation domain-containing protein
MAYRINKIHRGFTLIELLVVIAIIGILSAIVLVALDDARERGRDGTRKSQFNEVLKALEMYYSDFGFYPDDGTPGDNTSGDTLSFISSGFISTQYLKRLPDQPERYYYCVSDDRKSILLAVDTENDGGGSEYCAITRGTGSGVTGHGCDAWIAVNATESCTMRF